MLSCIGPWKAGERHWTTVHRLQATFSRPLIKNHEGIGGQRGRKVRTWGWGQPPASERGGSQDPWPQMTIRWSYAVRPLLDLCTSIARQFTPPHSLLWPHRHFFPSNTLHSIPPRAFTPVVPSAQNSRCLILCVAGFFLFFVWVSAEMAFPGNYYLQSLLHPWMPLPFPSPCFYLLPPCLTLWNYLVFSCVYFGGCSRPAMDLNGLCLAGQCVKISLSQCWKFGWIPIKVIIIEKF